MSKPTPEVTNKKHFFLIAGNVVYRVAEGTKDTNPMGIISLNGVITSDTRTLGVNVLNEAQQVLQHHFRVKTEDPAIEIIDVIILNMVHLGYQTEEEFNNLNITSVQ